MKEAAPAVSLAPPLASDASDNRRLSGMFALDGGGHFLSHDDAVASLLGLPGASFRGRRLAEFNSQFGLGVQGVRAQLALGQQSSPEAQAATTADGRPAILRYSVLALADGAAAVAFSTEPDLRDIAQRSLGRRQSLGLLAARAGLLSWEYLPQRGSFTVDESFARLLGANPGAAPGNWLEALFPEDRAAVLEQFNACSSGQNAGFDAQFRLRTAASGYRWFQGWAEAVEHDDDGRVTRVIGLMQDVSAEKLAAAALANARRDAEQAGRAKSAFLAAMSHELRTPLNGVLGMLSLLERETLPAEAQDCVQIAIQSGNALFELINTILDFSRLDAGGLQAERSEFELRPVIEDALDRVADEAQQKGLTLALRVAADVPAIIDSDPGRLRQILQSLLGNAVKFTARGSVVLRVARDSVGGGLTVSVTDTGIGIEPALHASVFEPFTQADGRVNRAFGGTGIGLSLTRRLVRLLGGEIALDSAAGEGACFTVHLPLTVMVNPLTPATVGELPLAGRRLLVLVENPVIRDALKELLVGWGAQVDAVTEPQALADDTHDALLLADQPRAAARAVLQALGSGRRTPAIVLSGLRKRPAGDELLALADDALHWPVRAGALLASLRACFSVDRREARPTTAEPMQAASGTRRVLVVDDVRTNLTVAAGMLRKLGISADLVDSGAAAVDAVGRISYDLILMDCQMPGMSGLEATRYIRARYPAGDGPRIVAMTANDGRADREACSAAGMHDFLSKPLLMSQLERVLSKWTGMEIAAGTRSQAVPLPVATDTASLPEKLAELLAVLGRQEVLPILDRYESDGIARIARMREQLRNDARSELLAEAHALKGSSANLGIPRMAELSAQLERALKADDASATAATMADLVDEFPGECMRARELVSAPGT